MAMIQGRVKFEPRNETTNNVDVHREKTARIKLVSLVTHCVHREYSDQTGQMLVLICVFALCTLFVGLVM